MNRLRQVLRRLSLFHKRGFKRVSYNQTFQMCVMFSDDFGVDEEAVDLGGPRREVLRLLMEALAHSQMFEGRKGKANLALESSALRKDQYFFAGQAIAVSLVHGGPAPGFCSYSLYSSLTGRSPKPEMEEIADLDLYAKVKKHIPGNAGVLHAMITAYSQGKAKILYTLPKKFQYT
ncbi:unnamed protein product [Merluccius merluccius]